MTKGSSMTAMKEWFEGGRVAIAMLTVQVISGALQIMARIIFNQGTFVFAYLFYRHVVGAVCIAPLALHRERDGGKKLSWGIFLWLFVVALTGLTMALGLFCYGMSDTTATYATNFLTLVPVVTFLFSTILRMEKVQLRTKVGKMKILGTAICFGGALIMALYKGKAFYIIHRTQKHHRMLTKSKPQNWTLGTIFLIGSCLSNCFWFISQGTLATALSFCMISWAVAERGPTYPAMFTPLRLIFVAIGETLFLDEVLTVGGLLGMSLIIIGFYSFLWAKNKEIKAKTTNADAEVENMPDESATA
ncbi:protein WALLS ARE THIN 1-like [Coffea eugenioides]|uniref:protein WALLS ARE THIN 1-like n=1 Tax=Coffea eugenioides TaxID=49369 RepID=UPI000F6083BB|nr:protein WALLS ARE THIN 1-like [Coffea eugenioides]